MFEFANPWVVVLLPLPLFIYWLLPPMHQRSDAVVISFMEHLEIATGKQKKRSAWVARRSIAQWLGLSLAWISILLALAKPQIVGKPEMKVKTARSLLVAADISHSMDTRDWVVDNERLSRWEAIKRLMGEFIEKRDGDRLSLVFFGTEAYLQTPFTTEVKVVRWFLDETEVGMAGQMTSIGKAIGFGMKMFESDTLEQKVMLLLTDGRDGGKGISPLDAAYLAKADSVKIYTIGIGNPDLPGTDLDEESLKQISEITGGKYFRAMDQQQLAAIYSTLDQLEPMEFEEEEAKPITSLYYYPLIAALLIGLVLLSFRVLYSMVNLKK
ncbi:VWA domain-containing protein [Persicobacter psychrovividus]|uniref:VWFA domain-containing protein n=1 Tax=Persicobacter psychrovividus TaxID=387638 RepID=A0ABM7VN23_9BACT|nr:hypothetical protein PEPS_46780 [Persicobacter psychrovividus]